MIRSRHCVTPLAHAADRALPVCTKRQHLLAFFYGAPGMARSAVTGAVGFTVVVSLATWR